MVKPILVFWGVSCWFNNIRASENSRPCIPKMSFDEINHHREKRHDENLKILVEPPTVRHVVTRPVVTRDQRVVRRNSFSGDRQLEACLFCYLMAMVTISSGVFLSVAVMMGEQWTKMSK